MTKSKDIKCSICSILFNPKKEGVIGDIGILPTQFCQHCFNGLLDMAEQFMCPVCPHKEDPDESFEDLLKIGRKA